MSDCLEDVAAELGVRLVQRFADAHIEVRPIGKDGVVVVHPQPVPSLPGYADGAFSVQDAGAQLTQSLPILNYLEERYPERPLLPQDLPGRAAARAIAVAIALFHRQLFGVAAF